MARPLVGLLHNPAVPQVVDYAPELVEYLEIIPDRLWYDFGIGAPVRFVEVAGAKAETARIAAGRRTGGHGLGLSLPSALPLDKAMLAQVGRVARAFGFAWYSEHMSFFLTPGRSVPNAQAGLGLPVPFDDELFDLVAPKVRALSEALGIPILLENSAVFAPIPDCEMSEPAFFNRLHAETGARLLLDLHNLHTNRVNWAEDADAWIAALDPGVIGEVHLAGGDWLHGHYTDSHSRPTPPEVWDLAYAHLGQIAHAQAIVYEFHESWFERLGVRGIASELEAMHRLADAAAAH